MYLRISLFCAFFSISFSICPEAWNKSGTMCYKANTQQGSYQTYDEAVDYCNSLDIRSTIARPSTETELKQLSSFLEVESFPPNTPHWLHAIRITRDGLAARWLDTLTIMSEIEVLSMPKNGLSGHGISGSTDFQYCLTLQWNSITSEYLPELANCELESEIKAVCQRPVDDWDCDTDAFPVIGGYYKRRLSDKQLEYRCDTENQVFPGYGQSFKINCTSRNYTASPLVASEVADCERGCLVPESGLITGSHSEPDYATPGGSVKVICNLGHRFTDTSSKKVATCQEGAQQSLSWDLSEVDATCDPLVCKPLPDYKNLYKNTSAHTFGSYVNYTCVNETSFLDGSKSRILYCNEESLWNTIASECLSEAARIEILAKQAQEAEGSLAIGMVMVIIIFSLLGVLLLIDMVELCQHAKIGATRVRNWCQWVMGGCKSGSADETADSVEKLEGSTSSPDAILNEGISDDGDTPIPGQTDQTAPTPGPVSISEVMEDNFNNAVEMMKQKAHVLEDL